MAHRDQVGKRFGFDFCNLWRNIDVVIPQDRLSVPSLHLISNCANSINHGERFAADTRSSA